MKTLTLFTVFSYMTVAQVLGGGGDSFHGISISGTTIPSITNNSDQSLLGMVFQTLDTNGVNPVNHDMNYDRILRGTLLQPEESTTYSMMNTLRPRVRRMDSNGAITQVSMGTITGYKILAVLLADGTFYSKATVQDVQAFNQDGSIVSDSAIQDTLFQRLSTDISTIRSIAQSLQGQTIAERNLSLSRSGLPTRRTLSVSVDPLTEAHRQQISIMLSQLNEEDRTTAIARVAALPNVVKGDK